jgi:undecaprenyl-diphosphatase
VLYLNAFLLSVVEGFTEFLPISSTGHLILLESILSLSDNPDSTFPFAFMVIIQLPAILAVVVYFWGRLWPFNGDDAHREATTLLWFNILVAVLPAVVLGLIFNDVIEEYLAHEIPVAIALFVGGVILIAIEHRGLPVRLPSVHDIQFRSAFAIGLFQCLAMLPGTSRSAATIIGAMLLGSSRAAAAEFSFFLAIPTMFGATLLTIAKSGISFTTAEWLAILLGSVVSFVTAYGAVAFLMHYIQRHDLKVFGYYRIVLAGIVVISYYAFQ